MSIAIRAENISKKYNLGTISSGTLFRDLNMYWAKMRGKPNPYAKLGENGEFYESEHWALKDVSFEIKHGEAVGIIGRNGAGKSTLLKILSRVTTPTTGQIKIKGRVASLLEVGTGFHPEMTGRENIFLNGAILGMTKSEIKNKFDEIVDFAGIEKYIDTPVKRYSSGMYVRLAFAVAAHLEPEILIVDEVLAVGDAEFQKKCLGKMNDVSKKEGRTVLFVSHNMGMVSQLCTKGILLKNGSLIKADYIKNVIGSYLTFNDNLIDNEYSTIAAKTTTYFNRISTRDENNNKCVDFSFDTSVNVFFEFTLCELIPSLQIGIAMVDKLENRVFTILKDVNDYAQGKTGNYSGKVKLPSNLFAPNNYRFVLALWTKSGTVYDLIENVCPIKIHDSGTELAMYEDISYGNVIINAQWA